MAVSKDGYVQRTADDDMSWTGRWDKAAFALLTGVGGVMGAGRRTYDLMPKNLKGRTLKRLSLTKAGARDYYTLEQFNAEHPHGWLIGGLHVAAKAFGADLIDEAHICRSDRFAFPDPADPGATSGAILGMYLTAQATCEPPKFYKFNEINVGDCKVEQWRRHC